MGAMKHDSGTELGKAPQATPLEGYSIGAATALLAAGAIWRLDR